MSDCYGVVIVCQKTTNERMAQRMNNGLSPVLLVQYRTIHPLLLCFKKSKCIMAIRLAHSTLSYFSQPSTNVLVQRNDILVCYSKRQTQASPDTGNTSNKIITDQSFFLFCFPCAVHNRLGGSSHSLLLAQSAQ